MGREFRKCPECLGWHYNDIKCDPVYHVYNPDTMREDEYWPTRAASHEDAAIKYARYYNEDGEYSMMNGGDIAVEVDHNGIKKYFTISAEPSIHYNAKEEKGGKNG